MRTLRWVRTGAVLALAFAIIGTARWRAAQSPPNWRAEFAEAVLKIPFGEDRSPMLESGVPRDIAIPDSIADLKVAAARTRDTSRGGRILFRISSDKGYAPLGIAPGLNYLWGDMVHGKTRLLVIPRDPKANIHWLDVRPHPHSRSMNVG